MTTLTRRRTLQAAPLVGLALLSRPSFAAEVAPTPACGEDSHPTAPNAEGPFFKPSTPNRASLLEPGMKGDRLVVTGQVLTTGCKPIANALLDFWHADHEGVYDNTGFKLRGHQMTDAEGRFRLETILPGLYPGRTRHFHVKAAAPGGKVLTTQLYFPGERFNARDGLFRPDLVMAISDDKKAAQFNFILQA
ncbi:MAG: intradiol ring-cleavage dioxygenase [Rhodospirillaceae bacterium]|nr:intradiol ring-cleavage dioxygenase [Rhodospirillaceae bacterium]